MKAFGITLGKFISSVLEAAALALVLAVAASAVLALLSEARTFVDVFLALWQPMYLVLIFVVSVLLRIGWGMLRRPRTSSSPPARPSR